MKKLSFIFWSIFIIILFIFLIWSSNFSKKSLEKKNLLETSREVALSYTTDEQTQFHIHPNISIIINGINETIPANLGISSLGMTSIHTHDSSGVIHIESPVKKDFVLADFFAVWKKEFSKNQLLNQKIKNPSNITVTVNDKLVNTYENTVMNDLDKIVIEYRNI